MKNNIEIQLTTINIYGRNEVHFNILNNSSITNGEISLDTQKEVFRSILSELVKLNYTDKEYFMYFYDHHLENNLGIKSKWMIKSEFISNSQIEYLIKQLNSSFIIVDEHLLKFYDNTKKIIKKKTINVDSYITQKRRALAQDILNKVTKNNKIKSIFLNYRHDQNQ